MKKFVIITLAIVLLFLVASNVTARRANDGGVLEDTMDIREKDGSVKTIDLGEPTEEEESQADREEEWKEEEDEGFDGGEEDTLEEMAGDDSDSDWVFEPKN
ncbi:MAG: hypothetical protein ISS90_00585 [Candidatus Omnitrophica bacterium]|nr:hypothetical protein [Candidatus Omnitrophota bacterium]